MTPKQEAAMRQALEALEETRNALAWFYDSYPQDVTKKGNELLPHVEVVLADLRVALTSNSRALEQPAQQEPVATMTVLHLKDRTEIGYGPYSAGYDLPTGEYKLYTRPQPAAQFAGSYGTIDESAARRIATALGWKPPFSWVGLTQQDIDIAFDDTQEGGGFNEFARAIEQRLKEKNT